MFEAYVPKAEFGRPDYSVALKEHVDWEGMLPLSALYSSPPPPPPDIQGGSSTSTSEADGAAATNTASSPPSALSRFVPAFLRRSRPSSTPSDNNNHTNGNGNATNTNDEKIPVTQQLGKNGKVQVAVLIAMPVPPNSSSSSRPSTSSLAAAPPHVLPQHPLSSAMSQAGPSYVDDEEDLPHIEVGVAVVPVLGSDDDVATSSGGSLSEDERKRMSEGQASTSYDVQDGNIARML
ncbi:hypothetical protein ONZ45_g12851 [Pleurotus djamor]|nr:hypothetical protein ONZ45_g12851 [Pleurotus djamor]